MATGGPLHACLSASPLGYGTAHLTTAHTRLHRPSPSPRPRPGVHRFSKDELRANLARRGAETSGDKQALFERLREALREAEGGRRKQLIAHDVVANVLVGAEEAEARLEQLLARKRELVGEA